MSALRVIAALAALAIGSPALAGPFDGWTKLLTGDGSTWYYYPASVKPMNHVQTGKWLGEFVWAGWQNADGSYSMGQYEIYCKTGSYSLKGAVEGNAAGVETPGQNILFDVPYRPGTFPYILAAKVCPPK